MKFVILTTDYFLFLQSLYSEAGLKNASYDEQMEARNRSLFGVADFYSKNLRKLGHEAWEIHANNENLQKKWNHGLPASESPGSGQSTAGLLQRAIGRFKRKQSLPFNEYYSILSEQIRYYSPDVLLNQDMVLIEPQFIRSIKKHVRLVVGQHATTQIPSFDFSPYDLVVSSYPPAVQHFQRMNIPAELHLLGFEETILDVIPDHTRDYDLTFIGNLFQGSHDDRILFMEDLCGRFPQLGIWSGSVDHLPPGSNIIKNYKAPAWGKDLYSILKRSKITLNHHETRFPAANNCRLYEATGMGALLITDWKENLQELFVPGREIATYKTKEECMDLIEYYLSHDAERNEIANCGQTRTLKDHTYAVRMREFEAIISRYL